MLTQRDIMVARFTEACSALLIMTRANAGFRRSDKEKELAKKAVHAIEDLVNYMDKEYLQGD